ncbi:MAG: serine/threonine protein kinase [Deltaproteobacteria bacterium]|nr:serine/threonine protein kinase [Deltaproteobacteria bacterium]
MDTERVDKYELLEAVGSGGMAVVYRGRDTVLHREVAVKVLHPHLAGKDAARRRFLREARAVARLHHPGIIEIYDYSGDDAPKNFIVTEFVRGRNLRQFVADTSFRSPEAAALVCHRLASALEHAHASGVVHRDIKPDNVLVSERNELKIADFGIAHVLEAENLTVTGAIIGSPAHMSPEQIEGKPSDARSDVFSLGTILYWMATGRTPFAGETPTALFRNIIEGRHEDPRAVNPAVDNRLARIIEKMIAPDPEARYPDMGEVRRDIASWLADVEILDPEKELADLLENPDRYLGALAGRLLPVLRRRAAEELKKGNVAAAMNYCNRVLAAAPGDAQALRIIGSVDRARKVRRACLMAAAVVLLAAAAAGTWFAWPPKGEPAAVSKTGGPASIVPHPTSNVEHPAPSIQHPASSIEHPASVEEPPEPEAKAAAAPRQAPRLQTPPLKKAPEPRKVKIFVKPYADIFIDGKLFASDSRSFTASLEPGSHRVEFRNNFFESQETPIEVPEDGPVKDVRVELTKVRPALLKVQAPPGAEIYLDDTYKGLAAASMKDPVVIPMPRDKGSRKVTLRVVKPGFKSHVQEIEMRPGETKEVKATLAPEPR